jgi:Protein of unknown function (DUF3048) N-terminal domain/Protein of unknown function (DUF3048) C-terminal domain
VTLLDRARALSTKQRVVAAASAVVVVAAGVGISVAATRDSSARPVAAPVTTSSSPTPTPTPTSTPPPPPKPAVKAAPRTNPFTGIGPPPTGAVVAVKVEDTANGRPQRGVNQADIVYVEQVEAGLTRLIAIFASHRPVVEPVRSVRSNDPELLSQYGPIVVAASGGGGPPLQAVASSILRGVYEGGPGFARDYSRSAPYNLTVNTAVLAAASPTAGRAKNVGFTWSATVPGLASALSGRSFRTTIGGPDTVLVGFDYDPATHRYVRIIDGNRQTTADGAVISTPNVVIQYCDVRISPGEVDVVGNPSKFTTSIGSGPAVVFRNGHRFLGRWSRPTLTSGTTLLSTGGHPIPLALGGTWVLLVAKGTPLSVR